MCGDGTLLKTILKAAPEPSESPKAGDKVTVHYVGRLTSNGEEFDSSRSRDTPFVFTVGSGVITGWSEAVPTMQIGEISKFTIASSKAYGDAGSPPKIPGGASLDFEIELISFTDRENVNMDDPPVLKKTLKKGEGWKHPNSKCDLTLELDGTKTEWPIGQGDPLVRIGIESMTKLEEANFLIEGKYYDVTLLDWVESVDCAPEVEEGAVVKKEERPHDELSEDSWKVPKDTARVFVRGQVKIKETGVLVADFGTVGEGGEKAKEGSSTWLVDEHDGSTDTNSVPLCEGIEAVIRKMKIGEVCTATIKGSFGYKTGQAAGLDLEARLELCAIEDDKSSWQINDDEKVEAVDSKRALGNKLFSKGDFRRATRRYTQAVDIGTSDYDLDDENKKKLKIACDAARLNRAACYLRTKEYAEAREDAQSVLDNDPENAKALFRRAKALAGLDEWPKARQDLKRLLEKDPNMIDAKRALVDVAKKEKAYKEYQKKLYAGRKLFKDEKGEKKSKAAQVVEEAPPPAEPATSDQGSDE